MTILWCGGEDVDFQNGNVPTTDTGWRYDSSFSRGYVSARIKSTPYWSTPFVNGVTSCWLSFKLGTYWNPVNNQVIGLIDSGTGYYAKGIYAGFSAYSDPTYKMALYKWDGVTLTLLASESYFSFMYNSLNKFDLQIVNYGNSSTLKLYYEGSLRVEYYGDISITGVTNFNAVGVRSPADVYLSLSEIIVADEDTRLMRLKTHAPNATGDSSTNWTGTYTDIDETTISDLDKIYSSTADADFQCNVTGMPTGSYRVKAVKAVARVVDGSGNTGVALGVKTNGTVNVGDTENCSGYWQTKERLMNVNPVTGVEWTSAEVEALQLNIRAKAL